MSCFYTAHAALSLARMGIIHAEEQAAPASTCRGKTYSHDGSRDGLKSAHTQLVPAAVSLRCSFSLLLARCMDAPSLIRSAGSVHTFRAVSHSRNHLVQISRSNFSAAVSPLAVRMTRSSSECPFGLSTCGEAVCLSNNLFHSLKNVRRQQPKADAPFHVLGSYY